MTINRKEVENLDVYDLLRMLHSDKSIQKMQAQLYRDEPILRSASQLQQATPQKIREMRTLSGIENGNARSMESLFYQQGNYMADFADDYHHYDDFTRYFPTYQTLTDRQLRGYFTWRADVRQEKYEKAPTAYAFLYCYELLNLIGTDSPDDALAKLRRFYRNYRSYEPTLVKYVPTWLDEFIIYYGLLPQALSEKCRPDYDKHLLTLLDENAEIHSKFLALTELSSNVLSHSRFYKEQPELTERAVCYAYDAYAELSDDPLAHFFGQKQVVNYFPFESAVFYFKERQSHEAVYKISELRQYRCVHGNWMFESYSLPKGRSAKLTRLLRAVDARLRIVTGYHYRIKQENLKPKDIELLDDAVKLAIKDEKQRNLPKVEIDFSKLQTIREGAESTCEKLVLPEERAEAEREAAAPENTEQIPQKTENPPGLSENAAYLLDCLLHKQPYDALTQANGVMLSLLVDEINERLYDEIGDTVLEQDGDTLSLVPDYLDDLKAIFRG